MLIRVHLLNLREEFDCRHVNGNFGLALALTKVRIEGIKKYTRFSSEHTVRAD